MKECLGLFNIFILLFLLTVVVVIVCCGCVWPKFIIDTLFLDDWSIDVFFIQESCFDRWELFFKTYFLLLCSCC